MPMKRTQGPRSSSCPTHEACACCSGTQTVRQPRAGGAGTVSGWCATRSGAQMARQFRRHATAHGSQCGSGAQVARESRADVRARESTRLASPPLRSGEPLRALRLHPLPGALRRKLFLGNRGLGVILRQRGEGWRDASGVRKRIIRGM